MTDVERGMPGYASTTLPTPAELEDTESWTSDQWQVEFDRTRDQLIRFLAARDPLVILARTAMQFNFSATERRDGTNKVRPLEQVEVEIAQALVLMSDATFIGVPTSPRNFVRYWHLMSRHIHGFIRMQPPVPGSPPLRNVLRLKARLQTLYHRNLFSKFDCEETIFAVLQKIDRQSQETLGYRLSALFQTMAQIADLIEKRVEQLLGKIRTLLTSKHRSEVICTIEFFRSRYPLAERTWRDSASRFPDLEDLRAAGYQMSEFAWPWAFTIDRQTLDSRYDPAIVAALYSLALAPGSLKFIDPRHIYLNNPIWKKPYVLTGEDQLFIPIPQLIFSFPFQIMEGLIGGHRDLQIAYEDARAKHLENAVASLISISMPSASVYHGVVWDEPDTGKRWENDVVALLGNFVFVFEAKSGRFHDAARRGGDHSLISNFKELFVEPGMQGWRLQNYLDKHKDAAVLRLKADDSVINLHLDRPKVVFRYTASFEHFTNLTSTRHYLKDLGLIGDTTAWAPAISLGELQMISRYLDTELSFQHYLTRRASIDELIDLDGDEQDILSIYLTNGLCVDAEPLKGQKVTFLEADAPVRTAKAPRKNRGAAVTLGVQLSPLWAAIVKELYRDTSQCHRFDIINVILNQLPPILAEFERTVRRFRRGVLPKDGDTLITKFPVGKKVFVLACHLAKAYPNPEEWQDCGRRIVAMYAAENSMVECATFVFVRRSKEQTFDGVSFYRYGFGARPADTATIGLAEAQP